MTTRADRAGLRVEDIARPPLKMRARLYRLDAQVRSALKLGKARTRRAKAKKGPDQNPRNLKGIPCWS